jgi:hypothetical protein
MTHPMRQHTALKGNHNYLAVTASKSNFTLMQDKLRTRDQAFVLENVSPRLCGEYRGMS